MRNDNPKLMTKTVQVQGAISADQAATCLIPRIFWCKGWNQRYVIEEFNWTLEARRFLTAVTGAGTKLSIDCLVRGKRS